jgi:hypothetical protein
LVTCIPQSAVANPVNRLAGARQPMHNRRVLKWNRQISLFDRLRRASALRFVFVIAAVLGSQNFLACAFEEFSAAQATEVMAGVVEVAGSGDDCSALCLDCAHCGGCCSFAAMPRAHAAPMALASFAHAKISLATAAPELWTPPALLRPPISAA